MRGIEDVDYADVDADEADDVINDHAAANTMIVQLQRAFSTCTSSKPAASALPQPDALPNIGLRPAIQAPGQVHAHCVQVVHTVAAIHAGLAAVSVHARLNAERAAPKPDILNGADPVQVYSALAKDIAYNRLNCAHQLLSEV